MIEWPWLLVAAAAASLLTVFVLELFTRQKSTTGRLDTFPGPAPTPTTIDRLVPEAGQVEPEKAVQPPVRAAAEPDELASRTAPVERFDEDERWPRRGRRPCTPGQHHLPRGEDDVRLCTCGVTLAVPRDLGAIVVNPVTGEHGVIWNKGLGAPAVRMYKLVDPQPMKST